MERVGDILAAGHAGDVAILFGSIADAFAYLAAFASDLAPEQFGGAGSDGLKLEQALHEGALAGAVGAQQPDRPRRDRQVHPIQRALRPEDFRQGLRFNDRRGRHIQAHVGDNPQSGQTNSR
jgi:hypothetical protein